MPTPVLPLPGQGAPRPVTTLSLQTEAWASTLPQRAEDTPPPVLTDQTKNEDLSLLYIRPELYAHFSLIGKPAGAYDDPVKRNAEHMFWKGLGAPGVRWLIERMDEPREMHHLWGLSELLSAIGEVSIVPVLDALEAPGIWPGVRRSDGLLSALRGMDSNIITAFYDRIKRVIDKYLSHPDDSVREQAADTTDILSPADAISLLNTALTTERDPDVIEAINNQLESRSQD